MTARPVPPEPPPPRESVGRYLARTLTCGVVLGIVFMVLRILYSIIIRNLQ